VVQDKLSPDLRFSGVFEAQIEDVRLKVFSNGHDSLENRLFWKGLDGMPEPQSMKFWMKLVPNSALIIDVGANTGLYSLLAAQKSSSAKIHAFEPSLRIAKQLRKNIEINRSETIKVHEVALSDHEGYADFYDVSLMHQTSASLEASMVDTSLHDVKKVEVSRLDRYEQLDDGADVDLIKIDVEKHEVQVLNGMIELLKKSKPAILIEVLEDEIGKGIEDIIEPLGYRFFEVSEVHGLREKSHIQQSQDWNYLLLQSDHIKYLGLDAV
jgi:FkbM family methyltransferase